MGAELTIVLGIVLLVLVVVAVILYTIWQALLLRYQEEPDAHELHSVTTKDGWDLKLYRYRNPESTGDPVFLCHGAFANHTNFTKPRGACLVDTLLAHGYDCWLIDFRGTRSSEPALGKKRTGVQMDDFLHYDIPAALTFIRQVTGRAHVHWIGHSLGGMLLYAHVLLHGNGTIASGTTLGSPIGFKGTRIRRHKALLAITRQFPHLAGIAMRVGGRMARTLHPRSSVFPINWKNLHPLVRGRDLFNMIETPAPRMTMELAHWAASKQWRMNNGDLDVVGNFHRLNIPLFAVYGAADPFVPVDEAIEFVEALPHPDKQIMILGKEDGFGENYSHVDLAFGKDGVEEVYEPIVDWLMQHSMTEEDRFGEEREGRAFMARRLPLGRPTETAGDTRAEVAARIAEIEPAEYVGAPAAILEPEPLPVAKPKRVVRRAKPKPAAKAKAPVKKKTPARAQALGKKKALAKKKPVPQQRKSSSPVTKKAVKKKPATTRTAARKPAPKKPAVKKKTTVKEKVTAKRRTR